MSYSGYSVIDHIQEEKLALQTEFKCHDNIVHKSLSEL